MASNSIVSTIVKLLIASLIIGMLLTFFDITPERLLASFGETVQRIFQIVVSFGEWSIRYILVGAVVVVPIWLIMLLLRVARRKSGNL